MILDHLGIDVSDYKRSKEFYRTILKPLGIELLVDEEILKLADQKFAGFGKEGKAEFWIGAGKQVTPRVHIAFSASSRDQVDQFYETAIQAGAKDNGKPGIREIYHPNYYGAFVIAPDGHNVEAVCHKRPE